MGIFSKRTPAPHDALRPPTVEHPEEPNQLEALGSVAIHSPNPETQAISTQSFDTSQVRGSEVSLDQYLAHPEVKDMVYWEGLKPLVFFDRFQEKIAGSPIDRALKRNLLNNGFSLRAIECSQALANLLTEPGVYQKGDIPGRDATGKASIGRFVGQLPPYLVEREVYGDIFDSAVQIESLLTKYNEKSKKLAEDLTPEIEEDPLVRFKFASLLGEPLGEKDDKSKIWFRRLIFSRYSDNGSIPSRLADELAAGAFDNFIASELTAGEAGVDGSEEVDELIDLMKATLGRELSDEELVRFNNSTELWPENAQKTVQEKRNELIDAIQASALAARRELEAIFGAPPVNGAAGEAFQLAMTRMISTAKNVRQPAVRDRAPQVMRRSVQERPVQKTQTQPPPAIQESLKHVENTLIRVNRDGIIYDESSQSFTEMVQEIINEYQGTPGLEEDVEKVIHYLRTIDLNDYQAMRRSGFAKLSEGTFNINIDGQIESRPLYRFKPIEAAGLPLKTNIMKKHRVYLSMIDRETLAILGIVRRDKSTRFLSSMGINSGQQS